MQPSAVQSPREKCRWVRLFSTVKERNNNILLNILLSMDVYDFDEACDIIDDHRGLKEACIRAWEIIKN